MRRKVRAGSQVLLCPHKHASPCLAGGATNAARMLSTSHRQERRGTPTTSAMLSTMFCVAFIAILEDVLADLDGLSDYTASPNPIVALAQFTSLDKMQEFLRMRRRRANMERHRL